MKLNYHHSRFMRILFLMLATSNLSLGVLNVTNLKVSSITAIFFIGTLLICELFFFKRPEKDNNK